MGGFGWERFVSVRWYGAGWVVGMVRKGAACWCGMERSGLLDCYGRGRFVGTERVGLAWQGRLGRLGKGRVVGTYRFGLVGNAGMVW